MALTAGNLPLPLCKGTVKESSSVWTLGWTHWSEQPRWYSRNNPLVNIGNQKYQSILGWLMSAWLPQVSSLICTSYSHVAIIMVFLVCGFWGIIGVFGLRSVLNQRWWHINRWTSVMQTCHFSVWTRRSPFFTPLLCGVSVFSIISVLNSFPWKILICTKTV